MDVKSLRHSWLLGLGNLCRAEVIPYLNDIAVQERVYANANPESSIFSEYLSMRNRIKQILNNFNNHAFLYSFLIFPSIVDFLAMTFDYRFYLSSKAFLESKGLIFLSDVYPFSLVVICLFVSVSGCYLSMKAKQVLAVIFGLILNIMSFWLAMLGISSAVGG